MKKKILFLISFLALCLSHFIPINFISGSYASFFSGTTIAAVLIGKYSSLWSLVLFFMTYKKISFLNFLYFCIKRMPLFFASWAYKSSNVIVAVFVPFFCMILFIMHPIGGIAWPYAMYWLIPVGIFVRKKESLFLNALSSVFVAHAVGSVVWIYTHDMSAASWFSLIPVVAFERIFMAYSITSFELILQKIKNICVAKLSVFYKELA